MKDELQVRIRTSIYWNKTDNHFLTAFKFCVQGLFHSNLKCRTIPNEVFKKQKSDDEDTLLHNQLFCS